jgi:hypothetical protein
MFISLFKFNTTNNLFAKQKENAFFFDSDSFFYTFFIMIDRCLVSRFLATL